MHSNCQWILRHQLEPYTEDIEEAPAAKNSIFKPQFAAGQKRRGAPSPTSEQQYPPSPKGAFWMPSSRIKRRQLHQDTAASASNRYTSFFKLEPQGKLFRDLSEVCSYDIVKECQAIV